MDQHNLDEIYRLNQRGGRQLSLLDLIAANTVDLELAAYLAGAVRSGASLLTAARPGNAGKTTVLAAALAFLPPGRRILTVADPDMLSSREQDVCLLAHEIGSGPYYGYLWGAAARRFFEASGPNVSAISCIHADTLEELREILCGGEIGLPAESFARIDVLAFLRLDRVASGWRRRVTTVYEATQTQGPQSHRRVFHWDEKADLFHADARPERFGPAVEKMKVLLNRLRATRTTDFDEVFEAAQDARIFH